MTLARAIIGQQVSTKAADAVWDKFIEAAGKRPTPVAVLRVGIDGLRQAGLSQRKAEYVLDLAAHFGERRVHPERWADMDDEAVISELVAIRGIGRWTAEMF